MKQKLNFLELFIFVIFTDFQTVPMNTFTSLSETTNWKNKKKMVYPDAYLRAEQQQQQKPHNIKARILSTLRLILPSHVWSGNWLKHLLK